MNHTLERCLGFCPVFCTNFEIFLFNFSPRAISYPRAETLFRPYKPKLINL